MSCIRLRFALRLQKALGISNVMQVPRFEKIVLNVGVKEAVAIVEF